MLFVNDNNWNPVTILIFYKSQTKSFLKMLRQFGKFLTSNASHWDAIPAATVILRLKKTVLSIDENAIGLQLGHHLIQQ